MEQTLSASLSSIYAAFMPILLRLAVMAWVLSIWNGNYLGIYIF